MDSSVFIPSTKCAENTAIAESSLISTEKVNKVLSAWPLLYRNTVGLPEWVQELFKNYLAWLHLHQNWFSQVVRENQTCTKSWLPFCVAFARFFPEGNWPFSGTGKPHINPPLFPPPGNRGQKVTRNGGPQIGACLILCEVVSVRGVLQEPDITCLN